MVRRQRIFKYLPLFDRDGLAHHTGPKQSPQLITSVQSDCQITEVPDVILINGSCSAAQGRPLAYL
jgi:hypothetical protein